MLRTWKPHPAALKELISWGISVEIFGNFLMIEFPSLGNSVLLKWGLFTVMEQFQINEEPGKG